MPPYHMYLSLAANDELCNEVFDGTYLGSNQNKLTDMQRYQRTYFEKDLEKRIYNIIQDKIEAKLNLFKNQIHQSVDKKLVEYPYKL